MEVMTTPYTSILVLDWYLTTGKDKSISTIEIVVISRFDDFALFSNSSTKK